MEAQSRAIATVSVAASALGKESSGSGRRTVSTPAVPFLRSATTFAASLLAAAPPAVSALNYDDMVNKASQSTASEPWLPEFPSVELPPLDLPSVDLGGASDFVAANPLALVGVVAAVAVPLLAARAFAGPTSFGSVSAVEAYEKLSDPEQNAQLLDIRAAEDVNAEGSPNLRALRKRPLKVAYAASDDAFVEKVLAKCKIAEDTSLYVLDRFDGSAATVAKLLANSGFKSAYSIRGGAEGQNGWREKELPWSAPAKAFKVNIDGLKNIMKTGEGAGADGLAPAALGVAAVTGVGLFALSEAETALQLLGTVAALQLFVRKFLFAEDRKKTIADIKSYLDTKIAPKEFVDEIKEVGRAILPSDGEVKAAVETGATVLEKELNVDSVTPETLAEKAKEKAGEVGSDLKAGAEEAKSAVESTTESVKSSNGSAAPAPGAVEEEKPEKGEVTSKEQHDAAQSAFEGDEPSAFEGEGVGEDNSAEKLKGATASSSVDTSS